MSLAPSVKPQKVLHPEENELEKKGTKKLRCNIEYKPFYQKITPGLGDLENEERRLLLTHWNVNGLKSKLNHRFKQLHRYLRSKRFDFILLNETKLSSETFEKLKISTNELWRDGYNQYWAFSVSRKGYSGTTILARFNPIRVIEGIGHDEFDSEGRTLTLEYRHFYIVAVYVPNSGGALARLEKRVNEWDKHFEAYIESLKCYKPVLVVGDLNVSHRSIDVSSPDLCHGLAGFTPEERNNFAGLLEMGWADVFRDLYPSKRQYTWFSGYGKERTKGNCWRLDYCIADQQFKKLIDDVIIRDDVQGSDHCPVEVYFSQKKIFTNKDTNPISIV